MQIARAGRLHQIAGNTMRYNLAPVQDNDAVTLGNLVDEMGSPKHADIPAGGELADMPENRGAGFYVEADSRLIEKKKSRPVNQSTGDFQTPHLSAGQISRLIMGPVLQLDTPENLLRPHARFRTANSVQCGVIVKVLGDGEIQVECARLKYDPQ
jgi:hypothetical protein